MASGFLSSIILSSCAVTNGADVATARDKSLPILITSLDTYRHNPDIMLISENLSDDIVDNNDKKDDAAIEDVSSEGYETNDIIGIQLRFINLLDQDIQAAAFSFRAYDKDFNVIDVTQQADASLTVMNDTASNDLVSSEDVEKSASEKMGPSVLATSVNNEENLLVVSLQERVKVDDYNQPHIDNHKAISNNTALDCVSLVRVDITTVDGAVNTYEGAQLLSSSQVPRCKASPIL
jgi:hypothetical protein